MRQKYKFYMFCGNYGNKVTKAFLLHGRMYNRQEAVILGPLLTFLKSSSKLRLPRSSPREEEIREIDPAVPPTTWPRRLFAP
jgi:hypothetical protein